MLLGIADHEAYAIIGLDSFSASKALMENDMKRKVSDREVQIAFGIDYGIKTENLFFIEQPGDFHLDMNMVILGEKTVVVNDSIEAYEILNKVGPKKLNLLIDSFQGHPPEDILNATKDRSLRKKVFEDEASRHLQEKGFNVVRFPGRFELYLPGLAEPVSLMNFFNMVSATTPHGEKLIIAMGCPDIGTGINFQGLFYQMLEQGGLNPNFIEITFLDYHESKQSLLTNGGISCRVKTLASIQN
ncbi:MAG: hypothetical protein KDK96_10690 [Chlamydiia bacterium]|nr:hypothetical protein [Chlamydiia bacterium]